MEVVKLCSGIFWPFLQPELGIIVVPLLLAEFDASAAVRPTSRLAPESTAPLPTGQDFQFVISNFCLDVDGTRTGRASTSSRRSSCLTLLERLVLAASRRMRWRHRGNVNVSGFTYWVPYEPGNPVSYRTREMSGNEFIYFSKVSDQ